MMMMIGSKRMIVRNFSSDTIFALATAQGKAGVGIIRISGPRTLPVREESLDVTKIVKALIELLPVSQWKPLCKSPRRLLQADFYGGNQLLDRGMAVYFKGKILSPSLELLPLLLPLVVILMQCYYLL